MLDRRLGMGEDLNCSIRSVSGTGSMATRRRRHAAESDGRVRGSSRPGYFTGRRRQARGRLQTGRREEKKKGLKVYDRDGKCAEVKVKRLARARWLVGVVVVGVDCT